MTRRHRLQRRCPCRHNKGRPILFHHILYTPAPLVLVSDPFSSGMEMLDAIPNLPTIRGVDTRLNQIQVRPIEVNPRPEGGGFGQSAIQQAIVRGIVPPKFSGNEEDFPLFMKEFEEYVHVLGQQRAPNREEMLILFTQCLPPNLKKEVEFLKLERGDKITFSEVLQYYSTKYTRNRSTTLRKKLRELNLPTSGKVTPEIWRDFEIDFKTCIREIPDMSKQEIADCLRTKLPEFMMRWIFEREKEIDRFSPVAIVQIPNSTYTPEQAQHALTQHTKAEIKGVTVLEPGRFEVRCGSASDLRLLKTLNGHFVAGSTQPILVQEKPFIMGVLDIFEVVREELELKQRLAEANNFKNQVTRQTRPITTQPKEESRRDRSRSASKSEGGGTPHTPTTPKTSKGGEGQGGLTKSAQPPAFSQGDVSHASEARGGEGPHLDNAWSSYTSPHSNYYAAGPPNGYGQGFRGGYGRGQGYNQLSFSNSKGGKGFHQNPQWNSFDGKGYGKGFKGGPACDQGKGKGKGKGKGNEKGGTAFSKGNANGKGEGKGKGKGELANTQPIAQ